MQVRTLILLRSFLVSLVLPLCSFGQEISPQISVEEHQIGTNTEQKYFLMEHKEFQKNVGLRGLILILPGGPGTRDFLPFCANVLTLYGIPTNFIAAELIAPQWSTDENRIVWPNKSFPEPKAKFTTEEFLSGVIKDVCHLRKIEKCLVFTLGWSSSGHALYSASMENDEVSGSIIAMSRFKPGRMGDLERVRGKAYFLYHSPDDQICPFVDAQQAERTLKAHGAKVKLETYAGGHGWVPNTYYCDRIKEGIEWLRSVNIESEGERRANKEKQ